MSFREKRLPTVLVVEDDWLLRNDATDALEDAGWTVLGVASGEEALVLLNPALPIDLVFTDINLAGAISGWDVGDAAQRLGQVPVIYTSGIAVPPPREAWHFLSKPYAREALLEACNNALAASH
jgi:CheY-like chemotaxis protein